MRGGIGRGHSKVRWVWGTGGGVGGRALALSVDCRPLRPLNSQIAPRSLVHGLSDHSLQSTSPRESSGLLTWIQLRRQSITQRGDVKTDEAVVAHYAGPGLPRPDRAMDQMGAPRPYIDSETYADESLDRRGMHESVVAPRRRSGDYDHGSAKRTDWGGAIRGMPWFESW